MKRLILLLSVLFLSGQALAVELPNQLEETFIQEKELLGVDGLEHALPDEVRDLYSRDGLNLDFSESVQEILRRSFSESGSALRDAIRTGAILLAVSLLCAILGCGSNQAAELPLRLAGVLFVTLRCCADYDQMVTLGSNTLEEVSAFSRVLLPVLAGATTASGAPASAGALYVGTMVISGILQDTILNLFLPLTFAYYACACAQEASGIDTLGRICKLLKDVITFGLKLLLTAFSIYLALTGVISGSADSAAVKAAKLALSTVVPVIGSVISDASETVLVSAGMIRSGVGVLGLLGVLGICLTPFLRVGIQYLTLKLFAALSATVGVKSVVNMIDAAAACMGMLLAMVGAAALFNLISCVCFIKAVTP